MTLSDADVALLQRDPVVFIAYFSEMNLQDFQAEVLKVVDANEHERVIVLLPAGHGKSTLLVLWYVIFKIAQNRNIRIIVVMKNDSEVKQYARAIRQELSNNRRLIEVFGRFQPRGKDSVWSNDAIEVEGRQIRNPQPTVLFASSNSIDQVLGKRCDLFLCDDIVTPTTVSTQDQRDKQFEIFNQGIETGPQYIWDLRPDGHPDVPPGIDWPRNVDYQKGVLVGTVFHPDDLFHRKIERPGLRIAEMERGKVYRNVKDRRYVAVKYDCWRDDAETIPLWPGRWSKERFAEVEAIDRRAYLQRYRNIAFDEKMGAFKRVWFSGGEENGYEYPGCLNRYRSFGDNDFPRHDGKPFVRPFIILGLDPSTGRKGSRSTYSSFVVVKIDLDEKPQRRYLLDVLRLQIGFDEILSYTLDGDVSLGIEGFYTKYHYDEARIEENAAQSYLIKNQRVKEAGLRGIKVEPHSTQNANRNSDEIGVMSMTPAFKDGYWDIPYMTPTDQELADDYIDQLLTFPMAGLYDYAMATWFAETGIRSSGSRFRSWGPQRGQRIVNRSYQRA